MVHISCHVWTGDMLTLSSSPACQSPLTLSTHIFSSYCNFWPFGCVWHWPLLWSYCATSTGVTGLEGCPNINPIS